MYRSLSNIYIYVYVYTCTYITYALYNEHPALRAQPAAEVGMPPRLRDHIADLVRYDFNLSNLISRSLISDYICLSIESFVQLNMMYGSLRGPY